MTTQPDAREQTASAHDARFVFEQWHERTIARYIGALLNLYLPDAVLENPLVPRIMDTESGVLVGHDQLWDLFTRGRRAGRTSWCGSTGRAGSSSMGALWSGSTPGRHQGDQLDLVEVMDLTGPRIAHCRIYWGWTGRPFLQREHS